MKHKERLDLRQFARRLPALVVALLVALFIAFWVVRSAWVNTFARANPLMAQQFAPADPRVVAGLVDFDLRTRMGMARPEVKAKARRALAWAPLMEEPFLLAGIEQLLERDYRRADELLAQALARNPRSRLARLFMLEVALRAGRSRQAAADMTILSRLLPDVSKVFVPELARFARDPETREALRQVIATDPQMHANVLQHLADQGADPALVLHLAGGTASGPLDPDAVDWRRTLLESMVADGDVQRARQLWARFAGLKPEQAEALVYDGNFDGLPGLPPFNWRFAASEMGAAEPDSSGALFVEYYGRAPGELASQLLTLDPGRFRFSFYAEGDLNTPQNRLIWKVACPGLGEQEERTIFELPIASVTYAGRLLRGDFVVPGGCTRQWLRLIGQPTEFPKIESVLIRNLKIERIGGRA